MRLMKTTMSYRNNASVSIKMLSWFKKEPAYLSYSLNSSWMISSKRSACSLANVSLEKNFRNTKKSSWVACLTCWGFLFYLSRRWSWQGRRILRQEFLFGRGRCKFQNHPPSEPFWRWQTQTPDNILLKLKSQIFWNYDGRKVFVLGNSTDSTFGSIFPSPVTSKRLKTVPMNLVGKN